MSFFARNTQETCDREIIKSRQKTLHQKWKKTGSTQLFFVSEELSVANQRNCENMIGAVSLPVGLAGPVKIISEETEKKYFVPLATSEGALVASVGRGLKAINQAGGAKVFVKNMGMTRAPVFAFQNADEAFKFSRYLEKIKTLEQIKKTTESTSKHLKFKNLQSFVRGRYVYVRFSFLTGEAMGMNMVSIALQKLWDDFLSDYQDIKMLALSSNVCTDKKSSFINQLLGRGYSVQAEVFLNKTDIEEILKTNSKALLRTYQSKNQLGSGLAGAFSNNMQFANVVAAFFMATGQDLAHVAEASQGTTIIEENLGGLYFAVNLPDLPLGTVGGGLNLPAQKELRNIIHQGDEDLNSAQLAIVLAVGVLAAEISGLAALSSNSLAQAHQRLARKS